MFNLLPWRQQIEANAARIPILTQLVVDRMVELVAALEYAKEIVANGAMGLDEFVDCPKSPAPTDKIAQCVNTGGFVIVKVGALAYRITRFDNEGCFIREFGLWKADGKEYKLQNPSKSILAVKFYPRRGA